MLAAYGWCLPPARLLRSSLGQRAAETDKQKNTQPTIIISRTKHLALFFMINYNHLRVKNSTSLKAGGKLVMFSHVRPHAHELSLHTVQYLC